MRARKKTRGESLIRRSLGCRCQGVGGEKVFGWLTRATDGRQATSEAVDTAMEAGIWSCDDRLIAERGNETRFEDEEEKKWAWIVSREREYGGRRTRST